MPRIDARYRGKTYVFSARADGCYVLTPEGSLQPIRRGRGYRTISAMKQAIRDYLTGDRNRIRFYVISTEGWEE